MKRTHSLLRRVPLFAAMVLVAIVAFSVPRVARAATTDTTIEVDGLQLDFELDDSTKTATFTDVSGPASPTVVTVPSKVEYNGVSYAVTDISLSAWSEKVANVTELKLPDTITDYSSANFSHFSDLATMTIPGAVKEFNGSFQNCRRLESITFEEGVEDLTGNSMVSGCESLKTVNLPSSLKKISGVAIFSNATALESISLPDDLVIEENSTFSGCTALKSITLPSAMTSIPMSTFSGCTSLTEVIAPSTITSIGSSAFSDCSSLTTIPDLSQVSKMGSYAFSGCSSLTTEVDLSALNDIPTNAFAYSHVKVSKLSSNLTAIGNWAFIHCDTSHVTLPDGLQTIGTYAFYYGKVANPMVIPNSVTSIGTGSFRGTDATEFTIGSGLKKVDASIFPTSGVTKITFNNSQDDVVVTNGSLPASAEKVYTLPSIPDTDDTISDDADAPTLQEAINAAQDGDTIYITKNVRPTKTVTVPAGKKVTIAAKGGDWRIIGKKDSPLNSALISVAEGASLTLKAEDGATLTFDGRYSATTAPAITSAGELKLRDGVTITRFRVGDNTFGGAVKVAGTKASLLLDGAAISENTLVNGTSYSGSVLVKDGASVEMKSGAIKDNDGLADDGHTSSAGIMLYWASSFKMTGGTISGNKGHRGSAVYLWGGTIKDEQASFTMDGGEISGNTTTSTSSTLQGSAAVHVQDVAAFTMNDGTITGNQGVQGGGVCVVDGGLQHASASTELGTAFIMNGGIISKNRAAVGAGIYSYANGVELRAGYITDNVATDKGGGIYSEGNKDYYSTLHIYNAYVSGNTAEQGGGLWSCPTGEVKATVALGAYIAGNTAKTDDQDGKAAGDDVVNGYEKGEEAHTLALADRVLGGGSVTWYADGSVYTPMGMGNTEVGDGARYGTEGVDNTAVDDLAGGVARNLALKAQVSDDAAKLARETATLFITGNSAKRGGGIGTNGGVVSGDAQGELTKVEVSKVWKDDAAADRPQSVEVELLNGDAVIDTATLSADTGWKATFENLPVYRTVGADGTGEQFTYTVREKAVPDGYTSKTTGNAEKGFTITNTKKPGEPTNPGAPENPSNPDDTNDTDNTDGTENPSTPNPDNPAPKAEQPKAALPGTGDTWSPLLLLGVAGVAVVCIAVGIFARRGKK